MVVDSVLQGGAIQILHDNEGPPVGFANIVDGADVGMVERRSRLRLALKSAQCSGVASDVFRKELQRNEAPQPRVFRLVDNAHPATAQFFDDAVVGNSLTDHWLEILGPEVG